MSKYVSSHRLEKADGQAPVCVVDFKRGFQITFYQARGQIKWSSRTGYATDAEYGEALEVAAMALGLVSATAVWQPRSIDRRDARRHAGQINSHEKDE
jgi:hypothetical protein